MIKLLLDMGLPRRAATSLASSGLDVTHIGAIGRPRATDAEIVALAKAEGRTIVTIDSDFSKTLALTRASQPSVIHLRLQRLDHMRATSVIKEVLEAAEKDLEHGCIVTVTSGGARVRRLPLR